MPSAMVETASKVTMDPTSRLRRIDAAPSASTPMMAMSGRRARNAMAAPATNPPPPIGMSTTGAMLVGQFGPAR